MNENSGRKTCRILKSLAVTEKKERKDKSREKRERLVSKGGKGMEKRSRKGRVGKQHVQEFLPETRREKSC